MTEHGKCGTESATQQTCIESLLGKGQEEAWPVKVAQAAEICRELIQRAHRMVVHVEHLRHSPGVQSLQRRAVSRSVFSAVGEKRRGKKVQGTSACAVLSSSC